MARASSRAPALAAARRLIEYDQPLHLPPALGMRIALVCPNYFRDRSYQENLWAEQLVRLGHEVRVFLPGEPHGHIERCDEGYDLQSAAARKLPRSTYWCPRVHELVRAFKPELIVLFGDKTFALRVLKDPALRSVPLISTFSENTSMHEFDWRKRGIGLRQRAWAIGFIVTRGLPIRAACRRSNLIVGNTPQTRSILLRLFSRSEQPSIDAKMIEMPLGFSPRHISFDPALRQQHRTQLGVKDDEVLVCVTSAFTPVKGPFLAMVIRALRSAMAKEPKLKAVIVGFSDEPRFAAVSKQIAEQIASGPLADRFTQEPFADRERLNELFNACDVAAFARASISCQEALGAGLVGCFVDNGSLNHLITAPEQGLLFRPNDEADLADKLLGCATTIQRHSGPAHEPFRRRLTEASAWLGYDRIISSILDDVKHRVGPRTSARA